MVMQNRPGQRPIFRADPKLPAHAMQTYAFARPTDTHTRPASCSDVECRASAHGWVTTVDTSTVLGARQANYIRLNSGRTFTFTEAGTLVTFTFPPGQKCFREHRRVVERDPLFFKVGGDWRARTSQPIRMRPADWVDDFANHQDRLAGQVQKG